MDLCSSWLCLVRLGADKGHLSLVSPSDQTPTGCQAHLRAPKGPRVGVDGITSVFTAPPGPELPHPNPRQGSPCEGCPAQGQRSLAAQC